MSDVEGGSLQPALIPESPPLPPRTMDSTSTLMPQYERSKYTSPAPPTTSSITPPPSSQVPHLIKHVPRTPSPMSQLTSPPPTNHRPFSNPIGNYGTADIPSESDVENASMSDLRGMVENLSIALREARASAAHFKLQHNMLLIDSTEATKRMEVELQFKESEIEVLQDAQQRERERQDYISPAQHASTAALVEDLNRQCFMLQGENDQLRNSLSRTVQTLEDTDNVLSGLRDENTQLRRRIRTNREHMNGILESVSDSSPRSVFGTPHRPTYTPRHAPPPRPIISHPREPGAFEALLLADKVLNSQETATAPSTPRTTPLKHRLGHTRNTHSLSSLPTTPSRRPMPYGSNLRTPPHQLTTIQEPYSVGQHQPPPHFPLPDGGNVYANSHRRRASSDSTITASSVEEETKEYLGGEGSEDEDVPPSQASQLASSILRRTPKSSQAKLTQSRITGKVTKPGMNVSESEKRRLTSYGHDMQASPSKRGRVAGSGQPVGLGIGLPGDRR